MDVCPAAIEDSVGDTESEKSATKTVSANEELWTPLLPAMVNGRAPAGTAFKLLTVSVLIWPGTIELGLNEQLACEFAGQARLMLAPKPNRVEAEIAKLAESAPLITVAELLLVVS